MLDQSYYRKADEIIEHYGRTAASLIPIMQDIQAEYRYLPGELLTYVAKEIGVKEAKAYSVATFYENFSSFLIQNNFLENKKIINLFVFNHNIKPVNCQ